MELYRTPVQLLPVGMWEYCLFDHKTIVWRNRRWCFQLRSDSWGRRSKVFYELCMSWGQSCWMKGSGREGFHCLLKRCPPTVLALLTVKWKLQEQLYQAVGSTGLTACLQKWGGSVLRIGLTNAVLPAFPGLWEGQVPSNLRLRIRCRHVVPGSYVVLCSEYHRPSSLWAPRVVRCVD